MTIGSGHPTADFQPDNEFGSREWFDKLFGASPVGISITRVRDHALIAVNDAWLELMGYQRHEVIGRTRTQLNLWADVADREILAEKIRTSGSLRNVEVRYRRKTGEHSVLFGALETIEVAGERYVLGTAFDISDRKRAEDRYQHLASHDALTNLPNLGLLLDPSSAAGLGSLRVGGCTRGRHSSETSVMIARTASGELGNQPAVSATAHGGNARSGLLSMVTSLVSSFIASAANSQSDAEQLLSRTSSSTENELTSNSERASGLSASLCR